VTQDAKRDSDVLQAEVISFLCAPATHGAGVGKVEVFETHGALVFLAGDHAWKIKRAVRYAYMDFSTLDLRYRTCLGEIEINRPNAPGIYHGVVPITREPDGRLAIDGAGTPVEWAVHMRRFSKDALLSAVAATRGIDAALARDLADAVQACHAGATVAAAVDQRETLRAVVDELVEAFRGPALGFPADRADEFASRCKSSLDNVGALLTERARAGHVRRCHGDLHLANIVLWQGRPTLFDALEFDETLATIDTLYDVAFLLMDLDKRGQRAAANVVLNRYLWCRQEPLDLEGLAALPLFLALRAAIRAMVIAQRAAPDSDVSSDAPPREAMSYFESALRYLSPPPARLIAVGGLSGTGKSTLAAALAPSIGAAPGAVQLRSDLQRKALYCVEETERLDASHYTRDTGRRVYDALCRKAEHALAAGHAVIVDAVFLDAAERAGIEQVAASQAVPFTGLWLTATEAVMTQRVADRTGDASDATPQVVHRQVSRLASEPVEASWQRIDAGGTALSTLAAARALIG
jgi:aminoglycoside phosphotransferase family enzyme/predicted kinase